MSILCGAIRSPACFAEKQERRIPWTCMWCGAVGTHEHIFWKCRGAVEEFGLRPVPKDEWQKRYGWPTGDAKRQKQDDKVMDMVKAAE